MGDAPHRPLLAWHGIAGFKLDRIRVEVCVWSEIFVDWIGVWKEIYL